MAQKSKFTDRQKKNMVKCYVECQNYSAVARKYGCSETTVRRIVEKNGDVKKKVEEEKERNEKTVLEHMQKQTEAVCRLLDRLIEKLDDDEKLDDATAVQLATTLGIIVDKYTKLPEEQGNEGGGVIVIPESSIERRI